MSSESRLGAPTGNKYNNVQAVDANLLNPKAKKLVTDRAWRAAHPIAKDSQGAVAKKPKSAVAKKPESSDGMLRRVSSQQPQQYESADLEYRTDTLASTADETTTEGTGAREGMTASIIWSGMSLDRRAAASAAGA
jgi:hypothetical protein